MASGSKSGPEQREPSRPIHAAELAGLGLKAGQSNPAPASRGASDDDNTSTAYFHSAASSMGEQAGEASSRRSDSAPVCKTGSSGGNTPSAATSQSHREAPSPASEATDKSESPLDAPSPNPTSEDPSSSGVEDEVEGDEEDEAYGEVTKHKLRQSRERQYPSQFNATRQDYFSRHPNPDAHPRSPGGPPSSAQRQRGQTHASTRYVHSVAGSVSSQSDDGNRSIGGGGILSPALSTGTTLSSGVSLGATMGGNERIFPIRSVVAPSSSKMPPGSNAARGGNPSGHHGPSSSSSSLEDTSSDRFGAPGSTRSLSSSGTAAHHADQSNDPSSSSNAFRHPKHHDFAYSEDSQDYFPETMGQDYSRRSPIPDDTSDFSFPSRAGTHKPSLSRHDSNTTGSSSDRNTMGATSYPTTSRMSNDSDPTARRNSSTNTPSTVHSRGTASARTSSQQQLPRHPGMPRLDSQATDPDIVLRAKMAYDNGETEEGPSVNSGHLGSIGTEQDGMFLTVRFEHQETPDGFAILTGRKGELLKCEDEPIHIPGAIQDYGVLLAIEEDEQGNYVVQQVSENSGVRLGLPPKHLFSLKCFTEVLDEDQADAFREAMENLDDNAPNSDSDSATPSSTEPSSALNALNSFQLSGEGVAGTGKNKGEKSRLEWSCWCAVHRPSPKLRPRLAIVEFEIENDLMNPVMRERTDQEIREDKTRDQSTSLFGEEHESQGTSDPQHLPATNDTGSVSASGKEGPAGAFSGMGRADGEAESPGSRGASLDGMLGHGGDNGSSSDAPTSSGMGSGTSRTSAPPESPEAEGLGPFASKEEIDNSTISRVKPIRALRRLRKQKGGGDILKLFSVLGQINDELNKAEELQKSLEITAGVVAEITGFHRVMIYQFDEQWNGQVVAELVDPKQTRDLYRGLHFPASDIPSQARELYKLNKVRLLYDRDQPTARLVCRSLKELETPLDLTHSHLRAMSPIHIKYLANMGVRASMSISIIAFGQLWGLISCHTYGRYGQRVSFPGRQLCRIIGDSVSRNIERLSYAQRLQSRKLINTMPTNSNPGGYIIAKAEDLLQLFDAEFGVISISDEAKILGTLENSQEVLAVLEYMRVKKFDQVQASTNILADYPDLDYPSGFQTVAGMLTVPLARDGQDFIAFFRRGQLEHVHWAGNPYDKVMRQTVKNKTLLEPRKSFKIWSETVVGRSRAWSDENLETASVLRLVYGKFIEVWRQREAAVTSSRLTNLLLSNASHEVRTPLNHIINYLEMALEGQLDDDTRESLVRSHSASRALVHVINDLLDLTRTETGQTFFLQDPLDLGETIEEAVAIHRMEAQRHGIAFEVVENPSGTPQTLLGDKSKIRQIVANVTANAVRHTHEGKVLVEWGELSKEAEDPVEASQDTIKIGIAVSDTGVGIPEDQLEEMFRTFEQVESEDDSAASKPTGNLGLGLAVVARIVSQLGGQLRVESKVGQGSKFTFVLHFRLPGPESNSGRRGSVRSTSTRRSKVSSKSKESLKQVMEQERMNAEIDHRQRRSSSGGSLQSGAVSVRSKHSEIDSLVEAISSNPGSRSDNGGMKGSMTIPPRPAKDGQIQVEDSGTPLRSVRMDGNDVEAPQVSRSGPSAGPSAGPSPRAPTRPTAPKRQSSNYINHKAVHSMPTVQGNSRRHTLAQSNIHEDSLMSPPLVSPGPPPTSPPNRRMRIMIVEDDAINRLILLKKLTKDFSHEVKQAVHGEEAVRLYEKDREFDMILMDLQMPICDGYQATKRIRELEKQSPSPDTERHPAIAGQVPVFAVSASLHETQKLQLLECGFSGFVLKPVDFARLSELMKGSFDNDTRSRNQYQVGRWEKGGWLSANEDSPMTTPVMS